MLQSFQGPALARPGSETVSGVASQSGWERVAGERVMDLGQCSSLNSSTPFP